MYSFRLLDDMSVGTSERNGKITLDLIGGFDFIKQSVSMRLTTQRGKKYEPDDAIDWLTVGDNQIMMPLIPMKIKAIVNATNNVEIKGLPKVSYDNRMLDVDVCFVMTYNGEEMEGEVLI